MMRDHALPTASVRIINEAKTHTGEGWNLCLQWCEYRYSDDSKSQFGYRFIWRRPNGKLLAGRAQARLPNLAQARALMQVATDEGWGDHAIDP
jgi:hypothetical protein